MQYCAYFEYFSPIIQEVGIIIHNYFPRKTSYLVRSKELPLLPYLPSLTADYHFGMVLRSITGTVWYYRAKMEQQTPLDLGDLT